MQYTQGRIQHTSAILLLASVRLEKKRNGERTPSMVVLFTGFVQLSVGVGNSREAGDRKGGVTSLDFFPS